MAGSWVRWSRDGSGVLASRGVRYYVGLLSAAQRLGFLLELVGAGARCGPLKEYVRQRARNYTRLLPSAPAEGAARSGDWRLFVNARIEAEA